jgi:ABC-type sugar transport system ATPase subunit
MGDRPAGSLLVPRSNSRGDLRQLDRLRAEIAALTRENGATVLYITHDQAEAFALADRIGVLQSGRLVQCDGPGTIYRAPATPFVARVGLDPAGCFAYPAADSGGVPVR